MANARERRRKEAGRKKEEISCIHKQEFGTKAKIKDKLVNMHIYIYIYINGGLKREGKGHRERTEEKKGRTFLTVDLVLKFSWILMRR